MNPHPKKIPDRLGQMNDLSQMQIHWATLQYLNLISALDAFGVRPMA